jgi:hypothetical protein
MKPKTGNERKAPAYLFVRLPRCPECESVELKVYRTIANGDGSRTRYVKCAECGENAILVVE